MLSFLINFITNLKTQRKLFIKKKKKQTLKKFIVLPSRLAPNSTGHSKSGLPHSFKSSALFIIDETDSTVKKAAKLAV